jgi:YfiH family protein
MSQDLLQLDWPAPPGVFARVTLRAGGVSTGPHGAGASGGLNLGFGSGDVAEAVMENRRRLRAQLPAEPRWLQQVHGAAVVDAAQVTAEAPAADAAVTDAAGVVAVVMMADCLPVLLTDREGRAVGAAHAGWRGLAAGVLQATVAALRARVGAAPLMAWLGPAIGPDHFEVGAEVRAAMRAALPQADLAFKATGADKLHADLFMLARQALAHAGVTEVYGGGVCTYCDAARFYSHRRDRVTGRHAALIWREA